MHVVLSIAPRVSISEALSFLKCVRLHPARISIRTSHGQVLDVPEKTDDSPEIVHSDQILELPPPESTHRRVLPAQRDQFFCQSGSEVSTRRAQEIILHEIVQFDIAPVFLHDAIFMGCYDPIDIGGIPGHIQDLMPGIERPRGQFPLQQEQEFIELLDDPDQEEAIPQNILCSFQVLRTCYLLCLEVPIVIDLKKLLKAQIPPHFLYPMGVMGCIPSDRVPEQSDIADRLRHRFRLQYEWFDGMSRDAAHEWVENPDLFKVAPGEGPDPVGTPRKRLHIQKLQTERSAE